MAPPQPSFDALMPPLRFPPGYLFQPNDQQFVVHYMIKRALGHYFLPSLVRLFNIYQSNPAELSYNTRDEEQWGYFFIDGYDENSSANFGHWIADDGETPVEVEGEIVGYKKRLVFFDPRGVESCWRMFRYRLNQELVRLKNPHVRRIRIVVACKVFNTDHEIEQEENEEEEEEVAAEEEEV